MKKFLTEFKEFAVRGNVIDMAVGIVIGGAFSKIVTALVNMVMSVVGLFTSAVNLSELAVTLQRAGEEAPYFSLPYGAFLTEYSGFPDYRRLYVLYDQGRGRGQLPLPPRGGEKGGGPCTGRSHPGRASG